MITHFDVNQPLAKADFEAVYSIMEEAFPKSERRRKDEQAALLCNPHYHLSLLRGDLGEIEAFFAWWSFENFCYGEHFAVDKALRGKGAGGKMIDALTMKLQDAGPFVLEVEPPETETAARRIGFYRRHGFELNEYPYLQPPLHPDCDPQPLMIMSRPHGLDRPAFEAVRACLYREVYRLKTETGEELRPDA